MLNIVLVEPEIPQNCGNIARTCAATGCRLHLIRPLGFDISEKAVKRAGLDYWNLVEVRDYDNLEMKQLLDVLATFIMEDDNGLLVDAYNTTELGEKDCTCICVMDRFRFTKWLEERQDRLENISDF